MSSFANVYPTPGAVGSGARWVSGLPLADKLYAGYLLGTDYWTGTKGGPVTDLTMQGRDLVLTGAVGATAIAGPANFADTPFTGNQLCAARGEATLVAVAQVLPDQAAWLVSNRINGTSGVQWIGIRAYGSGSFAAEASQRLNGDEQQSRESLTGSSRSGNEFIAGAFHPAGSKLWRSQAGGGLREFAEDTSPVLASSGGTRVFRIGRSHASGETLGGNISAAFFFDWKLTTTEVTEFLGGVTDLLEQFDVAVAQ